MLKTFLIHHCYDLEHWKQTCSVQNATSYISLFFVPFIFTAISPEALHYPQWLSVNTWWSSILKPDVEVAKISIHPSFCESDSH